MNDVEQNTANASRIPPTSGTSASDIEVFYACPFAPTLSDFYAARVSPGITFRQGTEDGSHASGVFGNFYLAPMEQVDFDGMTFFVFEAQQTQPLTAAIVANFDVPDNLQGSNADFFWAIGAVSPFPFVADRARKDNALIHVAYAAAGIGPDKHAEFIELLHRLRMTPVPATAEAGIAAPSPNIPEATGAPGKP